jgi:hypothetical protein
MALFIPWGSGAAACIVLRLELRFKAPSPKISPCVTNPKPPPIATCDIMLDDGDGFDVRS